jgi:hypothetical protein
MPRDAKEFLDFLQPQWRLSNGDIRSYTAKVHRAMKDYATEDQKLFLQIAIAVAQGPVGKLKEGDLRVESLVSGRDHEPYVHLRFGDEHMQLPVEDARQHAHQVLNAADAAESDAFLVRFLSKDLEIDEPTMAEVLTRFRAFRKRREH